MIFLEFTIFLILMLIMYVEILPSMLHCLYMVSSLLVHMHHSCMIIVFVLYHQWTTLSLLILVQSPSECVKFIIHNSLFLIDTLYFWYLHFCIVYVCINITITICNALSMIDILPASACTCRFIWKITALLGIYILIVTIFLFK